MTGAGLSINDIAQFYNVNESIVRNILNESKEDCREKLYFLFRKIAEIRRIELLGKLVIQLRHCQILPQLGK